MDEVLKSAMMMVILGCHQVLEWHLVCTLINNMNESYEEIRTTVNIFLDLCYCYDKIVCA
jgi:hypothetical protein